MTIAEDTRVALRRHPFLREALQTGVINYTAAARFLDVGEVEAVAAALRRLSAELPPGEPTSRDVRIRIIRDIGQVGTTEDALLQIGEDLLGPADAGETALQVEGTLDAGYVGAVCTRMGAERLSIAAAGWTDDRLILVVERTDVADAIRILEDTAAPPIE